MKKFLYLFLLLSLSFCVANYGLCDDTDEWAKALDVYNSDGLDRPVSAIEYRKVMKELKDLKDKYQKVYGPLSIYYPCNKWRWLEEPWPWEGSEF